MMMHLVVSDFFSKMTIRLSHISSSLMVGGNLFDLVEHEPEKGGTLTDPVTNPTDPIAIMNGENGLASGTDSPAYLLDYAGAYSVLYTVVLMVGVIAMTWSFGALMVVKKKESRAEYKQDIMFKLILIFLAASAVSIFDILLMVGNMF